VILRQRKRSRFTMRPAQIEEWQLSRYLGPGPSTEDIVLGDRLSLLECSLGRVAVAICEDVARLAQFGPTISDAGVSLLLVPVFSKELREHYWEDVAAKAYANGIGAQVLIINSLAVAHARAAITPALRGGPVDNPTWHTAMLRDDEFHPGRCATGADVVVVPP
jgi:predicted amidohydrolase